MQKSYKILVKNSQPFGGNFRNLSTCRHLNCCRLALKVTVCIFWNKPNRSHGRRKMLHLHACQAISRPTFIDVLMIVQWLSRLLHPWVICTANKQNITQEDKWLEKVELFCIVQLCVRPFLRESYWWNSDISIDRILSGGGISEHSEEENCWPRIHK